MCWASGCNKAVVCWIEVLIVTGLCPPNGIGSYCSLRYALLAFLVLLLLMLMNVVSE